MFNKDIVTGGFRIGVSQKHRGEGLDNAQRV